MYLYTDTRYYTVYCGSKYLFVNPVMRRLCIQNTINITITQTLLLTHWRVCDSWYKYTNANYKNHTHHYQSVLYSQQLFVKHHFSSYSLRPWLMPGPASVIGLLCDQGYNDNWLTLACVTLLDSPPSTRTREEPIPRPRTGYTLLDTLRASVSSLSSSNADFSCFIWPATYVVCVCVCHKAFVMSYVVGMVNYLPSWQPPLSVSAYSAF